MPVQVSGIDAWLEAPSTDRPRDLAAALFGQWRSLWPGYWRAVRRVDRPMSWGAVLGVPLGTVLFLLGHGLHLG